MVEGREMGTHERRDLGQSLRVLLVELVLHQLGYVVLMLQTFLSLALKMRSCFRFF